MNRKKSSEYREQGVAGGRKQTTALPHEGQPVLATDSPTSSALWRLSSVLREISENLEPSGDKREPPGQLLTEELTAGDGECEDAEKRDI